MNKAKAIFINVFLMLMMASSTSAQKFSVVPEVGYLIGQVDGDFLRGYKKRGYHVGVMANYPLFYSGHLAIGGHFFQHGSRKPNWRLQSGGYTRRTQIELDLESVGVELSYIQKLKNPNYYVTAGILYHRILGSESTIHIVEKYDVDIIEASNDLQDANSFFSFKYGVGATISDRFRLNFSFLTGIKNIGYSVPSEEISTELRPYHMQLSLGYELISSKSESKKKRKRVRPLKGQ